MDSEVRCDLGGGNSGKVDDYLGPCAPDLQMISTVYNLIGDAKKPRFLQEINPKPDKNANRHYLYDRLAEDAAVNDRWCGNSRDKCRRAQPNPAFVQDRIFERDYLHN